MSTSISFSDAMLRALRHGTKTQTRRIASPTQRPPFAAGTTLYVKEALVKTRLLDLTCYRVDNEEVIDPVTGEWAVWRWQRPILPAMFCPQWASRDAIRLTEVRIEPLHAISEADAQAEGVANCLMYRTLWDTLYATKALWHTNPLVWVLSFARVPSRL